MYILSYQRLYLSVSAIVELEHVKIVPKGSYNSVENVEKPNNISKRKKLHRY